MVPFVLLPDTIEGDVRLCSRDRVNRHERGYSFTAVGVWGCPWWSLSTSVGPQGDLADRRLSRRSLADPPTLRGPGPCRVTRVGVRARGFRKSRIAGLPYPCGLWVRSLDLLTAQGGQPVRASLTELLHHQA